jgi:hypothetical protein
MSDTIAEMLDEAAGLPLNSSSRNRIEDRLLDESGVTTMEQLATFVEVVARRAAQENGAHGDEDSAEALFSHAQTVSETLRRLHELIQSLA